MSSPSAIPQRATDDAIDHRAEVQHRDAITVVIDQIAGHQLTRRPEAHEQHAALLFGDRLIALIATWYVEAGKYGVMPVDGSGLARMIAEKPLVAVPRDHYAYRPNTQSIPFFAAPRVLNRPHSITAVVELPEDGAEGVLRRGHGLAGRPRSQTRAQRLDQLGRAGGLVALEVRHHPAADLDAEVAAQPPQPPGVLGGDHVRGLEQGGEPRRRVADVPDGRAREDQPALHDLDRVLLADHVDDVGLEARAIRGPGGTGWRISCR